MRLLDEADDTSLVAGTLAGSPDAAAALFRRYVDGIFAFAFVRIRRDRAAASSRCLLSRSTGARRAPA